MMVMIDAQWIVFRNKIAFDFFFDFLPQKQKKNAAGGGKKQ
jgi:uroporphyrinogen-III synthase